MQEVSSVNLKGRRRVLAWLPCAAAAMLGGREKRG
jgi:hypothetical protein